MMDSIAPMSPGAIEKVRSLEREARKLPQQSIETTHTFHAGTYARTIMIPKNVMITGALIKIPTVLIVSGRVLIFIDGEAQEIDGYKVLSGSAGRKQAFIAVEDTHLTMIFSTKANTIEEAEEEFTDEFSALGSRRAESLNRIEGS